MNQDSVETDPPARREKGSGHACCAGVSSWDTSRFWYSCSPCGGEVVHTHVIQSATQIAPNGSAVKEPFIVTAGMVTEKGPAFSFKLTPPSGGLYKTWAQFMYRNRVVTVPFTFRVEEIWGKPATASLAPAAGEVQRATIVIDAGFQPAQVTVRSGRPVELTFVRKELTGCGNSVRFPTLGVERSLKPGERAVVAFTPGKSGPIPFNCGMKMYRGQVIVREGERPSRPALRP